MSFKFENKEINIDSDAYDNSINDIIVEIRRLHFDSQNYEDLEMLLEFESLEKLTISEDNAYTHDITLHDLIELNSRLNENQGLKINISFSNNRFFTHYNKLANKSEYFILVLTQINPNAASDNDEDREIKSKYILEYRAESDDDDPTFYESVEFEDDVAAEIVQAEVEDDSDEIQGNSGQDDLVVEDVTTVESVRPAEDNEVNGLENKGVEVVEVEEAVEEVPPVGSADNKASNIEEQEIPAEGSTVAAQNDEDTIKNDDKQSDAQPDVDLEIVEEAQQTEQTPQVQPHGDIESVDEAGQIQLLDQQNAAIQPENEVSTVDAERNYDSQINEEVVKSTGKLYFLCRRQN
ncbi:hypothetical protein E3Q22_01105 [Wallemia mellicola]|uniref:Uncharacterized protein n=1 Tax=Wallemia mellicola TaxID=1708541 RepID=A0A4T0TL15_9BASI|nr:hypothetical protein E3Q23_01949 [Wallemia mellicola]TIB81428.1 hypothetical protein E3Q22_01105 [Wallemia mellicola]TIB94084.1 hypothetical protein E3Q19_00611 [Wallemia mellicola]TIC17042.1 hypothetical protein E3Q15_00746 [Wallemia mellicola]TIC30279.1 hypothetical protein E3Q11_01072 [Wallemia mellicola]